MCHSVMAAPQEKGGVKVKWSAWWESQPKLETGVWDSGPHLMWLGALSLPPACDMSAEDMAQNVLSKGSS